MNTDSFGGTGGKSKDNISIAELLREIDVEIDLLKRGDAGDVNPTAALRSLIAASEAERRELPTGGIETSVSIGDDVSQLYRLLDGIGPIGLGSVDAAIGEDYGGIGFVTNKPATPNTEAALRRQIERLEAKIETDRQSREKPQQEFRDLTQSLVAQQRGVQSEIAALKAIVEKDSSRVRVRQLELEVEAYRAMMDRKLTPQSYRPQAGWIHPGD